MNDLIEDLLQLGFTRNEAKVYVELLKRGPSNGSEIAKAIGIDRALTYQVLNALTEKGFANYVVKEHKKLFSAASPKRLEEPIKRKQTLISQLIPKLNKIETVNETDQKVEVFEGKSGLRGLFEEIGTSQEFCFFGGTGRSYDLLKWEMEHIEKNLNSGKIRGRGIVSENKKNVRWTQLKNMEIKFVTGGESKNTTFAIIDGEILCILSFQDESSQVVFIRNKFTAKTMQNYFEVMWGQS